MTADLEYLTELAASVGNIGCYTQANKIREAVAELSAIRGAQVGAAVGAEMALVPREPTEAMIEKAVWQSNHYPVVPHGFEDRVTPLHPFAATVILREVIASVRADVGAGEEPSQVPA